MSALLYGAMSLLGRTHDRLTHVLVNEPFDDPSLAPHFYFPTTMDEPERLHRHPRTSSVYSSTNATLWLADVPFVRLRYLFPKQLGRHPGKFSGLVRAYLARIEDIIGPPAVTLDPETLTVHVADVPVTLAPREFALYAFLAEQCQQSNPPYEKQANATSDFKAWLSNWAKQFDSSSRHHQAAKSWSNQDNQNMEEDIRKTLRRIRQKFFGAGLGHLQRYLLPRRGAFGIQIRVS